MKSKITFIFLSMVVFYICVIVKAFYVQVINRDKLIAYSKSQVLRTIKTYPKRGLIYDRNNNPLAINVEKYNIFTLGKNFKGFNKQLSRLAKIIPDLSYEELKRKVKNRNKFTWLARKVELDEAQKKKLENLEGIYVEKQLSRFYPNNEIAAHILGFVGIDNDGLSGVEYFFNKTLKGQPLIKKFYRDAKGRPIKHKSQEFDDAADDLVLSIDKDIQAIVEKSLKEGVEHHKAIRGGAAVMDVQTGEVWAMANYPSYDPNNYNQYSADSRKLSFVTDPLEPGSIFKSLTVAAALRDEIIKKDTNYYCEKGKFLVDGHIITESDSSHNFEWLSVGDIIKYSSNIGTTKIAFDLTFPRFKSFLNEVGFGERTGIELTGESRGIFVDDENVKAIRLSNISFGQGIATTPIQILKSYSIFANNGILVQPTLLKGKSPNTKRILSKKSAQDITEMLVSVVEDGTGSNAKVENFVIAGKTSTAQKPDSSGGYSGYVSGFIGYPVNVKRKFVVYVYVDDPKDNGYYGNQVAAPIFKKITKSILYKNKEYKMLAQQDKKIKKDRVAIRQSSVVRAIKGKMPRLIGLDKANVKRLLDKLEISYTMSGYGLVSKQSIDAGENLDKNSKVKVLFTPPKYD